MKVRHLEFTVSSTSASNDVLIAVLGYLPIESFWEDVDLKFYIREDRFNVDIEKQLKRLSEQWDFDYEIATVPEMNWNSIWESSFDPVDIDDFCRVRASFHEAGKGIKYDILIDPKMAFGTGHHETTYMMIDHMSQLPINGKSVWDAGTGTGVLAILARKMGAAHIFANDIENEAIENARENARLNNVDDIQFVKGDIDRVPRETFDIILANINRNFLLQNMSILSRQLHSRGHLVLSGFLKGDETMMLKSLKENDLKVTRRKIKGNWLSLSCTHISIT